MSVMNPLRLTMNNEVPLDQFVEGHRRDDRPEQKVDTSTLGPVPMTTSVKLSLLTRRVYLVLMMLLVLYHVIDLAGSF